MLPAVEGVKTKLRDEQPVSRWVDEGTIQLLRFDPDVREESLGSVVSDRLQSGRLPPPVDAVLGHGQRAASVAAGDRMSGLKAGTLAVARVMGGASADIRLRAAGMEAWPAR